MTPDEWLDTCSLWARLWPHRPLPPESVEAWYDLLADLDGGQVRAALLGWAADPDLSWPPQSPGELRDTAQPDDAPPWTEALGELATLVRRHGRYGGRPELPPALDAYVDSVGGWANLCSTLDPADPATRAQFRDHYQTVRRRTRRDQAHALGSGLLPELTDGSDDG